MLTFLSLLQPPRRKVYLGLSWLKIYVSLSRWERRGSLFIKLGWGLVRWILLCSFLRITSCPRRRGKLIKCREELLDFGCSRTKNYTSGLFWAIFAMHSSWNSGAIPKRVARRDLWKSYKRQILVSQGPYSRILAAQYAKGSTRICEVVWPMSKICSQHSSARKYS